MPYPGSTDALSLVVDPYDLTTLATVVVTRPSGPPLTPTATSTDHHTWTASAVYNQTGRWVATWTVTGTGAGVAEREIWVSVPPAATAGVGWRPDLWQVADYIPGRTLVGAVDGYGAALNTFDDSTHPTGGQVHRLITAAVSWVELKTGPDIDPSLDDSASACVAIYTAAAVERGYPDSSRDVAVADQLYKQAVAMRDDLHRANVALTGTDPEEPSAVLLPSYSFPPAVFWGDEDLI